MPLVLEDGTGVVGANSYASVADADAFFADRNISDWAGPGATTPDKEGFLIQGADYLNSFYVPRGEFLVDDQGMLLPTDVYGYVPLAFKQAQILLAREAAVNGPLGSTFGESLVTYSREQLQGVGETETHYEVSSTKADQTGKTGSIIDAMLSRYIHKPGWIEQARVLRG